MVQEIQTSSRGEKKLDVRTIWSRLRILDEFTLIGSAAILIFMSALISVAKPQFLTAFNLTNLLKQVSVPLVLGIGATFVVMAGSMDLSMEGIMAISSVVLSLLVLNQRNTNDLGLLGIVFAILVGTTFGFLNGLLYVKLKIPSFMVTFGIWNVATGLAVVLYKGFPITIRDQMVRNLSTGSSFGVPNISLVALIIFLFALFLERFTKFGRYTIALGENEEYARLSGIKVDLLKIFLFTFAGFCFAIGGIMNSGRIGVGTTKVGEGVLFSVMAGVVVGGTAVTGGVGGVLNTLIGSFIIVVLSNAMVLLHINPYIQSTVIGLIVIAAVAITIDRSKLPLIT